MVAPGDPMAADRDKRKLEFYRKVDETFTYHEPTPEQIPKYEAIRSAAKEFARLIVANTPPCADQSAALRLLRECVMTANASIALEGLW